MVRHPRRARPRRQARAEIALGEAPCFGFTVEKEEAIICETPGFDSLMPVTALALVVRKKKPVAVLDVGIELRAMDFPDSRFLDLQIAFAPDFTSLDLRDRAPTGSTLVLAPSRVRGAGEDAR